MINISLPSKFSTLRIFIGTTQNKFERTTEVESYTTIRVSKLFQLPHLTIKFLKESNHLLFSHPTCLYVFFFSPKTIHRWTVVSMVKRNFATHERFTFRILSPFHTTHTYSLFYKYCTSFILKPSLIEKEKERFSS